MARLEIPGLVGTEYAEPYIAPELYEAFRRAFRSGAPLPLSYVGAGMYGIVFCDERNHAWKVMRLSTRERSGMSDGDDREWQLENAAQEYEWLRDAAKTSIARNICKVYALHPEEVVLERECVPGSPGTWADAGRLHKIHDQIEKAVMRIGWTAPEFKENSYIVKEDGTPVLVDISLAQRLGMNLAGWVRDVLDGRRRTHERWHDLAFYLVRERRYKTIPDDVLDELLVRLVEKDPEIKKSFSLKGQSLGSNGFEKFHSRMLERRLIKHQHAKKLIDPKAVAVCLHKPETEHQRERWYAVTPGFPYDQGAWRVSVWDKHGPSTHYSDSMHRGPFLTILQAVDDVLFEERRARIVEYILPSGEHIRVGKGPSCF